MEMKKINIMFSVLVVTLLLIGVVSAMNVNIIPADEIIRGSGTNAVYYDNCNDVPRNDRHKVIVCKVYDVPQPEVETPIISEVVILPQENTIPIVSHDMSHINITKETEEEIEETKEELPAVIYYDSLEEEIPETEEETTIVTSEAEQETEEENTIVGEKQIVTITEENVIVTAEGIPETEEENYNNNFINNSLIQKIIDFFKKVL